MENNKPYFSNFRLYGEKNLQVSFNVFSDTLTEHLANVDEAIQRLFQTGYSVDPKGEVAGSKIQDIAGWVLGKTQNKNQPCVYLYAGNPGMQYKVHTIWQEEIPQLPISIPKDMKPQLTAPTKKQAIEEGIFNKCNFNIVLVPKTDFDGNIIKTDQGKIVYKFDSVYGGMKETLPKETLPKETLPEDDPYYELSQNLSQEAIKMLKWGRLVQGDNKKYRKQVTDESLEELCNFLDGELNFETAGLMVLAVITNKDTYTIEEIKEYVVSSLFNWLQKNKGNKPNPEFKADYVKTIHEIWSATRDYMMAPEDEEFGGEEIEEVPF